MNHRRLFGCILALCLLLCTVVTSAQSEGFTMTPYDIVVAPDGSDQQVGSYAMPLRTIQEAKRRLQTAPREGTITVWLRGGTYVLEETLSFDSLDRPNTIYRSFPGEEVILSGATPVTGFVEEIVNGIPVWTAPVADTYFQALYHPVAGGLQPSRYPKQGFLHVSSVRAKDAIDPKSDVFKQHTAFYVNTSETDGNFKAFENANDVVIRLYHYWKDEITTIKSYDAKSKRLELMRPTTMSILKGDRYYFENVKEALGTMGEWYIDRAVGKLYYVPFFGENREGAVLYAGHLTQLVHINGIDGIRFEGITFAQTDWEIPNQNTGVDFPQAAYDVAPSIQVANAAGVSFVGCTFRDIGATCLKFGYNVQDAAVTGCTFTQIGANAIFIEGLNYAGNHPAVNRNIQVTNNHICKYGQNFNNGVGVLLAHARDSVIQHNEIHDGPYTAISVGWVWGYDYNVTDHILVQNNLIYNIGQGLLSDMGGIYTLGVQPNTVISGNVIHDVYATQSEHNGYGGWGIYLDEGSSYIRVEKNLVYRCGSQGFHVNFGMDNLVTNNIFANNMHGQVAVTEKEKHLSCYLHTNVIVGAASTFFADSPEGSMQAANNLFWDSAAPDNILSALKKAKYQDNAQIGDPLFVNADGGDYRLATDSPAFVLGFQAWNMDDAGTTTDFGLHK